MEFKGATPKPYLDPYTLPFFGYLTLRLMSSMCRVSYPKKGWSGYESQPYSNPEARRHRPTCFHAATAAFEAKSAPSPTKTYLFTSASGRAGKTLNIDLHFSSDLRIGLLRAPIHQHILKEVLVLKAKYIKNFKQLGPRSEAYL